jgi:hypothetical protein
MKWSRLRRCAVVLGLVVAGLTVLTPPVHAEELHRLSGVINGTRTPVAGAEVIVYRDTEDGWTEFSRRNVIGAYRFDVPDGRYVLHVREQAQEMRERHVPQWYGGASTRDEATPVEVAGSDVALDPVVLTDRALVRGRLVDRHGTPFADVDVRLHYERNDVDAWYDYTADDGTFAIPADPGRWRLGWGEQTWSTVYEEWYQGTSGGSPAVIAVGSDDIDLGDIVATTGAEVTGTVLGDDGAPLAGARVSANGGRWTTTDATGAFRLTRIPAGYLHVFVEHGEHAASYYPEGPLLAGAAEWMVDIHDTLELPSIRLSGRSPGVPDGARLTGVVRAASGAPVPGLLVRATSASYDYPDQTAVTGADGRYSFTDLGPTQIVSQWRLEFDDSSWLDPTRPQTAERSFDLPPSENGHGAKVAAPTTGVSEVPEVVAPLAAGLTGRVLDAMGAPAVGTRVTASLVGHPSDRGAWAEVKADGTYAFPSLPPGSYLVGFGEDGEYPTSWWPAAATREDATPVTLTAERITAGISLPPGAGVASEAPSGPTADTRRASLTARASVRYPRRGTGRATVVVRAQVTGAAAGTPATGLVTVQTRGRRAITGHVSTDGRATFRLAVRPGRRTVVVSYLGTMGTAPTTTVTVKVTKKPRKHRRADRAVV